MDHAGVGGLYRGWVRLDGSCWGGVGHKRVGWDGSCSKTT